MRLSNTYFNERLTELLCSALGKIASSHLTSLAGFPTKVFQSPHESSRLKHKIKLLALSLCCQRSGFSQASYNFPGSEIWSGKNLRITSSPFAQGSWTSREGQRCVPPGLCCGQALQTSPQLTHQTGSSQKNWLYCPCTNHLSKKGRSLSWRDISVWETPQP